MAIKGYLNVDTRIPIRIPSGSKILDIKQKADGAIVASILFGRDRSEPGWEDEISFLAIGEGMEVDAKKMAYAGDIVINGIEVSIFYKIRFNVEDTRKTKKVLWGGSTNVMEELDAYEDTV